MANVLPPKDRKNMQRRVYVRFITVGGLVFSMCAIIAILALVPAYASVRIARAALEKPNAESLSGNVTADQNAALRAQTLISVLRPIAQATSSPSTRLATALSVRPKGIVVTSISFKSGEPSSLVLAGTSAKREAIEEYRKALEGTQQFVSVQVPVGALLGTQEGRFSITLTGH